jgi:tellurite resistance protein TerC
LGTTPDAVDGRFNDGPAAAGKYLTGYVLEKALSLDNLFVIAVIFQFLAVPAEHQHRVLFWGVFGAMVLRGLMIGIGVELVVHHHWVLYLFGAFLLFTGVRLLVVRERPPDPGRNPVMRLARRFLPFTARYHGKKLIAVEAGRKVLTPLALAMILVETSDVMFATDSIPAVFAVTADPLLVFTSNIFAVLGLRTLYFALAGLMQRFAYVKTSLSLILLLVGMKIIAGPWIKPMMGEYAIAYLLGAIGLILAVGITASLVLPAPREQVASP